MSTLYDLASDTISDIQTDIESLVQLENELEKARKSKDKNARQDAESKIREIHQRILEKADVSIVYLFLTTVPKANADSFRSTWQKDTLAHKDKPLQQLRGWKLEDFYKSAFEQPKINFALLPPASWFIQFTFTLAKPYISKDDNPFYIIDNPVVRDKVFGLPMIRPTSWKGNLYAALWQLGHDKQDDKQMQRLFGETRSEEGGQAGRLYFYPTFFTQTGLEIINPHDRKRRVGKNPILFECVPAGASGAFSLLYVPFDLIGQDKADIRRQAAEDLQLVAEGIQAMMLTYGFSAKRTSGYGVAKESVSNGFFQIRVEEPAVSSSPAPSASEPSLPKYLQAPGKLKDEYLNPDGTFRERTPPELAKMSRSQRQEYEKARKWWEREGKALAEHPPAETQPEAVPTPPQWLWREFSTFDEMLNKVSEAEQALTAAGGEA